MRQTNSELIKDLNLKEPLDKSKVTKNGNRIRKEKLIEYVGYKCTFVVDIEFNDECDNGHNTFSITGSIYKGNYNFSGINLLTCGCIHDEISKYFPELEYLIKWHLCSTDSPMYYLENTIYHADCGNLNAARETAIWPDATLEQLRDKNQLLKRLPSLMLEFKKDMEGLGFKW